MDKNLTPKIILIIVLVLVALWTLYPPNKTLKSGIDLAGGTSLIYEIDTYGLTEAEKKDMSSKMITILRRRIDPANIQNFIWRPQGNTRFEIQMPLADAETRAKRQMYESQLEKLLEDNINTAIIMRSLKKSAQERTEDFENFAQNSPDKLEILTELAAAYGQRRELQNKRDKSAVKMQTPEQLIKLAGLDLETIKSKMVDWVKLDDKKLKEALTEFLGSDKNLDLLTRYTVIYSEWADVVEQLTDPQNGKNIQYNQAKQKLDRLNLTEEQINLCLTIPPNSLKYTKAVEKLKSEFPERLKKIESVISAFDQYRPFQGRLDDHKDLQRMLKGAGILEFRILPMLEQAQIDQRQIESYIELLNKKGPKYASDNKYIWCEIENIKEWNVTNSIVGEFGNKYYILASNEPEKVMLHSFNQKSWKLKSARPTQDQHGRRAIGFVLDETAGKMFGKITSQNKGRPLCILLDNQAISAPNIQSRITTQGIITGTFTQTETADMVDKLNAGSLPARLIEQPISVKTIGPSIGADNRDRGIKAGLIGLVTVLLCMLIYYCAAGAIADIALLMNLLFVLAIMALVRASFTLPGIAGIILTIGMSVDANVLIFERIREEQQKGSSIRIAIKNGYQRAFRTILDANLTTFITAAILFWVASEEIKGFAIVLMLGIASSMFTALFVTRVVFDILVSKRIIKERLFMLRLLRKPNVNWMRLRPLFLTCSVLLMAFGLFAFFMRDNTKNNKYDIEFTGGTSVIINLKHEIPIQQVRDRLKKVSQDLNNPAIATANVYSINKSSRQYEITTTETNKTITTVTFPGDSQQSIDSLASAIDDRLDNLQITQNKQNASVFTITTNQMSKAAIENVLSEAFTDAQISEPTIQRTVNNAILSAFGDQLEVLQNLGLRITSEEKITEELIDSYPELGDFIGGCKIICQIKKSVSIAKIERRLKDLRFKPDMRNLHWYDYKILSADLNQIDPDKPVNSFTYISVDPQAPFRELTEQEWSQFIGNETSKIRAAASLETSLPRVTQINPSVGAEAKTRALVAIVLSLFAIVTYIWIRFGDLRYGFAAIAALIHDVCITLGAVVACTYIAGTVIGEKLLIGDFKINLAMIAAFLTLIGYSLNDTIVIFDRIRENRRKDLITPMIINDSINQTISRTLLTSFTTFIVVLIMYIFGGDGLRGFTFAIGLGIIIGTYSSVAIAAPILLIGTKTKK